MASKTDCVIIKKYANRRLYNTQTSTYITLEDLAAMVRNNEDFKVVDARTGDDITRSVLTQVIFEEEAKGAAMLPINFMRQLISLYGENVQSIVPQYLDMTMDAFSKNQEKLMKNATDMWGQNPFMGAFKTPDAFAEMQRRNMEVLKQTFDLFAPFMKQEGAKPATKDETQEQIQALKDQVRKLNEEIDRLRNNK